MRSGFRTTISPLTDQSGLCGAVMQLNAEEAEMSDDRRRRVIGVLICVVILPVMVTSGSVFAQDGAVDPVAVYSRDARGRRRCGFDGRIAEPHRSCL